MWAGRACHKAVSRPFQTKVTRQSVGSMPGGAEEGEEAWSMSLGTLRNQKKSWPVWVPAQTWGSRAGPHHAGKKHLCMSTRWPCVTQGLQSKAGHQPPRPRTLSALPPAAVVRQGKRRGSLRPGAPLEKKGWEEGLWRQDFAEMVPGPQNSSLGTSVLEGGPPCPGGGSSHVLPPHPGSFRENQGARS